MSHPALRGALSPGRGAVRALETALDALAGDRVRTRSSVVALAIATAIVVCLTTLVERGRAATIRSLERAGLANLYLVASPEKERTRDRLTRMEAEHVAALTGATAALSVRVRSREVSGSGAPFPAAVYAVSGPLDPVFRMRAGSGRLLSPLDFRRSTPYCVIGSDVARRARLSAPVGGLVHVGPRACEVVGTLERSRVETAATPELPSLDWNGALLVPLGNEPADGDLDAREPVDIAVLAYDSPVAAERAAALAAAVEPERYGARGSIRIAAPVQSLRHYRQARRTFDRLVWLVVLLTAAAAIVGVSNLLSASVAARTREIGLRRAVGARGRDIVLQFQAEGLLLGVAGGGLGLLLGAALGWTVGGGGSGGSLSLAGFAALAAGSAVAGIATGIRPSIRASRIDPAEALRDG
jgi:putative ABC transport system permease protein